MTRPTHVLDGYKVLDFTQFIAGPTVTRLMAQMGAEVIKVEIAPAGDRTRTLPLVRDGRSGYFVQQNIGKRSRPRSRFCGNWRRRLTWWWRISRRA